MRSLLYSCVLTLSCLLTAADPEPVDPILDRLEKALGGIQQMAAPFEQEKHISVFDEVLKGKGLLLFQSPNRIRFEIREPFHSVLIVAGDVVGKYEQTDGRWQRLRLDNSDALALVMNQIADWMQGKFREQGRVFTLSAERTEGQTFLVLTPKPEAFARIIRRIELQLTAEGNGFSQIIIREPAGDHTVLRFTGDNRSPKLAEGTFDPRRPEPVEALQAETP